MPAGRPDPTLMITGSGIEPFARPPASVPVRAGGLVTFVNVDDEPHQIVFPEDENPPGCLAMSGPRLKPGERFVATAPPAARVCRFFDVLAPEAAGYQGVIVVSR